MEELRTRYKRAFAGRKERPEGAIDSVIRMNDLRRDAGERVEHRLYVSNDRGCGRAGKSEGRSKEIAEIQEG